MAYGMKSSAISCNDGGFEMLTLADGVAQGSDIRCRGVWVRPHTSNSGRIRMLISANEVAAQGVGIDITEIDTPTPFHISNLSLLSFWGQTDGDKVEILYRAISNG